MVFHISLRVHITFEFHDFHNFFHFWYSKTTILPKNKNAFKLKKFKFKAEIYNNGFKVVYYTKSARIDLFLKISLTEMFKL